MNEKNTGVSGRGIVKLTGKYAVSEDRDITELNYDLNNLKAKDFLEIEKELTYQNEFVLTSKIEFIDFYFVLVAAKASNVPTEVLDIMNVQDISAITNAISKELMHFSHNGAKEDLKMVILENPIVLKDTTIEEIFLDFDSIKGSDLRDIERTYQKRGVVPAIKKQFSELYCLTCAAKATGLNLSSFDKLSWKDHKMVVTLVQTFLHEVGA
ncbi:hypothetical protein [Ilyobacter polytropus]|uniref:Uncharacterized protein n=1 Tax=Ilyobacter polytropus (strain ATCC 51220 / DSM 2926 / LMG 16218 / CuHBu1) TaxID=572544 RepID=E3HBL4_ILYPC|nr:hypothetical protein [Ilyobacter polytropus]ADO83710.1 hypothetical protein Ilyop_1939 [Ilyobacter polytropus DSM 2926]